MIIKIFVLLLVGYSLTAYAQNQNSGFSFDNGAATAYQKEKDADKTKLLLLHRNCNKNLENTSTVANITLSNGQSVSCDDRSDLLAEFGIEFKAAEKCAEAYETYSKEVKDDRKTAEEKLEELKQSKIDATDAAQKDMISVQERIDAANEDLQKAAKEYQDGLNALEEGTNQEAQQKSKNLRNLLTQLQLELNKRGDLATQLNTSYKQCKLQAEAEYPKQLNQIQEYNRARRKVNQGTVSVSKNKIKTQIRELHADCITNANSKYQSELSNSQTIEQQLNQEIQTASDELKRLTGDQYQKKMTSLQQAFAIAQQKNQADIQRLNQEMKTIQNKVEQEIRNFDAQIQKKMEEATIGKDDSDKKKTSKKNDGGERPSYYSYCCKGTDLRSDVMGQPGVPDPRQCKFGRSKSGRSDSKSNQ